MPTTFLYMIIINIFSYGVWYCCILEGVRLFRGWLYTWRTHVERLIVWLLGRSISVCGYELFSLWLMARQGKGSIHQPRLLVTMHSQICCFKTLFFLHFWWHYWLFRIWYDTCILTCSTPYSGYAPDYMNTTRSADTLHTISGVPIHDFYIQAVITKRPNQPLWRQSLRY